MKEVSKPLEYKGKKYNIVCNLNVFQTIQAKYGTIQNWGDLTDGKPKIDENGNEIEQEINIEALLFGLTEMINEGIEIENEDTGKNEPLLTQKQVGRIITAIGINETTSIVNDVVIESSGNSAKKE